MSKCRNKPSIYENVLEYKGQYYKIFTDRMKVKDNIVESKEFSLLTLAAIEKELALKKREEDVFQAVGLALTRYGEEKIIITEKRKNRYIKVKTALHPVMKND